MAKKKISTDNLDFEAALKELESIVERMEKGDQTLEQSLQDFERGMELTKQCHQNIKQAELRVEKMLHNQSESDPNDLSHENS